MNIRPVHLLASLALLAGTFAAGSAGALTCYSVLDRSDNVIYRDTYPPVDLSDQGAAERERMRRRGEHLLAMETDRCPTLEFFLGNAGSPSLTVDQVIAGMPARSALSAAGVGADPRPGIATGGGGGGKRGATAAAKPAPAKSKSSSTRKY